MSDLPLTVPVHELVTEALRSLGELDRDEAYLLARLEAAPANQRTAALIQAIKDAGE